MEILIIVLVLNILFLIYIFWRYLVKNKKCNEIITDLENENYELKKQKDKLYEEIEYLKKEINQQAMINQSLKENISLNNNLIIKLERKRRESAGKSGGLQTENNKLKEQIKDLENKLKESMTDKYLVHKIRPSKSAPTFKMKMRSSAVESKIIKDIKEK